MALESLLESALGRRKATAQRATDAIRTRNAPTMEERQKIALENRRRDGAMREVQAHDNFARQQFLDEGIDRRASGAQPFSLVGKDWFEATGRKQDEAAWEGKDFNLGGMQGGRSAMGNDVFGALRQRMKTIDERQAESGEGLDRANASRRRDDFSLEQLRGARIGNDAASARNREFELHTDPAHQRDHTSIDVERGATMGTHARSEADLGFQQKLRQYFDPVHQGMLDNTARREVEPRLQQEAIKGQYDVLGHEATARGRVAEAEIDAANAPHPGERMLGNDTFVTNLIGALTADPASITPEQEKVLQMFRSITSRGRGGEEPQGQPIERARVEQYAREKQIPYAQAVEEAMAQGYVVR